jgi:hypothetical protein
MENSVRSWVRASLISLAAMASVIALAAPASAEVIASNSDTKCSVHNRCVRVDVRVGVVGGNVNGYMSVTCMDGSTPRRVIPCERIGEVVRGIHLQLFRNNGLNAEIWGSNCLGDCPNVYSLSTAPHPIPLHNIWFANVKIDRIDLYSGDILWDEFVSTPNSGLWP